MTSRHTIGDRIGIDTHGYDEPPDLPEPTEEELERLDEIEVKIYDLVLEYKKLAGQWPSIFGYSKNLDRYGCVRYDV